MRISLVEYLVGFAIFIIVVGIVGSMFIQPYMEARTYNKLTGSNVTTWDAIWVELRVQGDTND